MENTTKALADWLNVPQREAMAREECYLAFEDAHLSRCESEEDLREVIAESSICDIAYNLRVAFGSSQNVASHIRETINWNLSRL
jgi:hypothetical protein